MHLVIDANVISGYFKEYIGVDSDLTQPASEMINRLGNEDRVYLDEGGQIEAEWREPVQNEWFDPWLASLYQQGKAIPIEVDNCYELRNQLGCLGFPIRGRAGRDIWYVRTAKAVSDKNAKPPEHDGEYNACIVSEDLDFHDPNQKGQARGRQRIEILLSGDGPIVRYLYEEEQIQVFCVHNYMEFVQG